MDRCALPREPLFIWAAGGGNSRVCGEKRLVLFPVGFRLVACFGHRQIVFAMGDSFVEIGPADSLDVSISSLLVCGLLRIDYLISPIALGG